MTHEIISPRNPGYDAALRDAVMDLAPFYDPNQRCCIVREKVFQGCLTELRERNFMTTEKLDKARAEIERLKRELIIAYTPGVPQ
jgi:hypothetical protein